jgi:hypothetical protein
MRKGVKLISNNISASIPFISNANSSISSIFNSLIKLSKFFT